MHAHTTVTRNTKTSTITYKIYTTYLMNIKTVACFGALRCVCVCPQHTTSCSSQYTQTTL